MSIMHRNSYMISILPCMDVDSPTVLPVKGSAIIDAPDIILPEQAIVIPEQPPVSSH